MEYMIILKIMVYFSFLIALLVTILWATYTINIAIKDIKKNCLNSRDIKWKV